MAIAVISHYFSSSLDQDWLQNKLKALDKKFIILDEILIVRVYLFVSLFKCRIKDFFNCIPLVITHVIVTPVALYPLDTR